MRNLMLTAAALSFALATGAAAETLTFSADLAGSSEVPPVETQGAGVASASLDTESKTLSWNGSFSGLSGDATAAHIHGPAATGENAGVIVPLETAGASFKGEIELTDDQIAALRDGKTYINVHTAQHPDGEIRGQLEQNK